MSTKIHALADALGNPVSFFLTGGEAHDLVGADHLLPSLQAITLIADKAFDADERVIVPRRCRQGRCDPAQGRPPTVPRLRPDLYMARHLIENFFANPRIKSGDKQFRAIATRYDKTARNFLAAVHLTAAIWLN